MTAIKNRTAAAEELYESTWGAHSSHILNARDTNQLLDRRVTKANLATVKAAQAGAERLAAMTAPGAADGSDQIDSFAFGFLGPISARVTVKSDTVEAVNASLQLDGQRTAIHASATTAVAAAKRLVGAVEAQLAMQTGAETAFETARDHISTFVEDARDHVSTAVDEAREHVGPFVDDAHERISAFVETARDQVGPFVDDARDRVGAFVDDARERVTAFVEGVRDRLR